MSCFLNLLKSSAGARHLSRNVRTFSFIHHTSTNVVTRRNGINFFSKRFKATDAVPNTGAGAVKAVKVKLKVSDLRRLLSLAKNEKWKIAGKCNEKSFRAFSLKSSIFRSDWLSHHLLFHHHGSAIRAG
jgi:hypothetical protein